MFNLFTVNLFYLVWFVLLQLIFSSLVKDPPRILLAFSISNEVAIITSRSWFPPGALDFNLVNFESTTKTPWLSFAAKYLTPWTVPSWRPTGSSNSTPYHLKWISVTELVVIITFLKCFSFYEIGRVIDLNSSFSYLLSSSTKSTLPTNLTVPIGS